MYPLTFKFVNPSCFAIKLIIFSVEHIHSFDKNIIIIDTLLIVSTIIKHFDVVIGEVFILFITYP